MKLQVYVLCPSQLDKELWQTRALVLKDVEVRPVYGPASAVALVHELAAATDVPFVLCQPDVWFGVSLPRLARELVEELDSSWPGWGLCGNRGARWDGRVIDFTRHKDVAHMETALCPEPVLTLCDNLLLVNPRVLRTHVWAPFPGLAAGLPLSLECLQHGAAVLTDPRLMTLRTGWASRDAQATLATEANFRFFYRTTFVNHSVSTAEGLVDMSENFDYSYLSDLGESARRMDMISLYDGLIEVSRPSVPTVTICCRTQFQRPEMLYRAAASFAAAKVEAGSLAKIDLRLITDTPSQTAGPFISELQALFPNADIQCWYHNVALERHSRTDLLIAGIQRAKTDFIWFVDDDDYVIPAGARAVAREVIAGQPRIVVGNSLIVRERWSPPGYGGTRKLEETSRGGEFLARNVLQVLDGHNRTPICSIIMPVAHARQSLAAKCALGNYNEDYFVLLLMLTAARADVSCIPMHIAAVSMRPDENTVQQRDMAGWNLSYTTFLQEVLNNRNGNSPLLWRVVNTVQY